MVSQKNIMWCCKPNDKCYIPPLFMAESINSLRTLTIIIEDDKYPEQRWESLYYFPIFQKTSYIGLLQIIEPMQVVFKQKTPQRSSIGRISHMGLLQIKDPVEVFYRQKAQQRYSIDRRPYRKKTPYKCIINRRTPTGLL